MAKLKINYKFDKNKVNEHEFSFSKIGLFRENLDGSINFASSHRDVIHENSLLEFYNFNTGMYEIPKKYLIDYKLIS